jgi:hypothetical protein
LAAGQKIGNLVELYEQLAEVPCGNGYGQFVLGELAYHEGDLLRAKDHLQAFVKRTTRGRVALAVALKGELSQAKRLMTVIRRKTRTRKEPV